MNDVESTAFDVSLLEVAGFEFKTDSGHQNSALTITTELASFPFAVSKSPRKWKFSVKRISIENYESSDYPHLPCGYSSWSNSPHLSDFYINTQLLSKLPGVNGTVNIDLLMLAHVTGSDSCDKVLAMAVARMHLEDVVERVAIVVVPHACWELAGLELVTLDII
jgi:hypothetical protein